MPEFLQAILLGCVQGATEFLPISSSAHLLALESILKFRVGGLAFDVSLHLATLLAVVIYFRREILRLFERDRFWPAAWRIGVATLPVVIIGTLLSDFRRNLSPWFAVGGWVFSGTYLLFTRGRCGSKEYTQIPLATVLGIGLAQALAIFPGVSRSGATIAAGLWLGLARDSAAKFSFLIAIPAMLGAGFKEALDLLRASEAPQDFWALCGVGALTAFAVGIVAIYVLLSAVRRGWFSSFGVYNLLAAAAFAVALALAA